MLLLSHRLLLWFLVLIILFLVLLVPLVSLSVCFAVILSTVFSNRLILSVLSFSNLRISTRILLVGIGLSLVRSCSILVLHGGKHYCVLHDLVLTYSLMVAVVLLVYLLSYIPVSPFVIEEIFLCFHFFIISFSAFSGIIVFCAVLYCFVSV